MFTKTFFFQTEEVWRVNPIFIADVFRKAMFAVLLSLSFLPVIANWWIFCARNDFVEILNLISSVDLELQALNYPVNLTRQNKRLLAVFVFFFFALTFSLCFYVFLIQHSNLYSIKVYVVMSIGICLQTKMFLLFQFVFFVWSVKLRFRQINEALKTSLLVQDAKDVDVLLRITANLHENLVSATEIINRCYGVPVSNKVAVKLK